MTIDKGPSFFWDRFVPFVYSIGASVVILGAMGKIMHYDWGSLMLPIGLGVESIIFLIYAFQSMFRPSVEYQWEKVYPELAPEFTGQLPTSSISSQQPSSIGLTAKMDDMLSNANISPDIFDNLKSGLQNFTKSVNNLGEITNSGPITQEFHQKMKDATSQLGNMNHSIGNMLDGVSSFGEAAREAQSYREQFHKVSQNMSALNAAYEIELEDTNRHLRTMNSFYGNFSTVLNDMSDVQKNSEQFKDELNKLTNNLSSLNNVYGSMLSAMKG